MRLPFGWELSRNDPRQVRRGRRMFAGSRQDNTTMDWPADLQSIDEILREHLPTLVGRSRHEIRNNPHGSQYVRLCKVNIVGDTGIGMQARVRDAAGNQDRDVNRVIEEAWEDWGEGRWCDFERTLTWRQMGDTIVETQARDGEAILRVRLWDPGNPYGFALQLIDPTLLDVSHWEDLPGGNYVRLGVEFDSRRRPAAYHFRNKPGSASLGQRRSRVLAPEIVHVFRRSDVGQSRGIPWMATALYQLRQGGAYADAAVVAARAGAIRGGFFESGPGGQAYKGDEEDAQGNPVVELGPDHQFEWLPEGAKFSPYSSDYPRGEFAPFDKAVSRRAAAGAGTSYAALTGDLSETSFASMRQGVIYERDVWRVLQQDHISDVCRPVYRLWTQAQMLLGTLRINGSPIDPDRERDFCRVGWQPRSWNYVNPLQDAQANAELVMNRFRSISSVIRERGEDPDEVMEEWARDKQKLDELGIGIVLGPSGVPPSPPPPVEESEDVAKTKTEDN